MSQRDKKQELLEKILTTLNACLVLTLDPAGRQYITVSQDDGYETCRIDSAKAESLIKLTVYRELGKRVPKQWMREIVEELKFRAETEPDAIHEVHTRIAPAPDGGIYIDLCNQQRQVLKVTSTECAVHDYGEDQPFFLRPAGMTALPYIPDATADLTLLREFVNLPNDDAWHLLIAFMLYCYRPSGPYIVLLVSGTAGSSKSTFSRLVRSLIDPSTVSTQAPPRNATDLMITANNSHLLVLDNIRVVVFELSDGLCRLATGSGMRGRTLYSNTEETLIHAVKPCILNGIGDIASQPDLLSRSIQIDLPVIKHRRTEAEFNCSFQAVQANIFSGLMVALSKTLAEVENVREAPEARMADFYQWGIAVERALDWAPNTFKRAYANNQRDQMKNALADHPLAQVLTNYVQHFNEDQIYSKQTPNQLLEDLDDLASSAQMASKEWPESPHALSKRLKRIEPALRACGIGLEFGHSGNRSITVTKIKADPASA